LAHTVTSNSEQETLSFAESFASTLRRGDVVALYGGLGAGKTQFVKGVCRYFGVQQLVASPTFIMLNRYAGSDREGRELLLYHFDLYRIQSLNELYDLGFEEIFAGDGISLIEWAEVMSTLLPIPHYDVRLEFGNAESERLITAEKIEHSSQRVNHTAVRSSAG
jgi:tRNA threonylcarbamoyladenosine biosynthesis protein TsaE